jgi:hypothetical protein
VESLLADQQRLAAVGAAAQQRARSWGELDNAAALVRHMEAALAGSGAGKGMREAEGGAVGPAATTT